MNFNLFFLLDNSWGYMQEEERACVPLVVISPEHAIEDVQNLFQDNDYFGFESEKVKALIPPKIVLHFGYQIL